MSQRVSFQAPDMRTAPVAKAVARAPARPVAVASANPIAPADSSLVAASRPAVAVATAKPVVAKPVVAVATARPTTEDPPSAAPENARSPVSEPAPAPTDADPPKWIPPNWSGPTGGKADGAVSHQGRGVAPDRVKAELERVRASFEEISRERDLLRRHVSTMEDLIRERIGKKVPIPPRPDSASAARSASAPTTPRDRSPGSARKRITKEEEEEMLRRLYGKSWRPDRGRDLSGVEQLKAKLDNMEKKAILAAKPKCKVYNTKAEMYEAQAAIFERAKQQKKAQEARLQARRESQVPEQKKSTTPAYMRAVRMQQLAIPTRRPPKMPKGASHGARPAWFAGQRREPLDLGRSASAVH